MTFKQKEKLKTLQKFVNKIKQDSKIKNIKTPLRLKKSHQMNLCVEQNISKETKVAHITITTKALEQPTKILYGMLSHELGHLLIIYHAPTVKWYEFSSYYSIKAYSDLLSILTILSIVLEAFTPRNRILVLGLCLGIFSLYLFSFYMLMKSCKFSREVELKADDLGGRLLGSYELPLQAFIYHYHHMNIFNKLLYYIPLFNLLNDHPSTKKRIKRFKTLQQRIDEKEK